MSRRRRSRLLLAWTSKGTQGHPSQPLFQLWTHARFAEILLRNYVTGNLAPAGGYFQIFELKHNRAIGVPDFRNCFDKVQFGVCVFAGGGKCAIDFHISEPCPCKMFNCKTRSGASWLMMIGTNLLLSAPVIRSSDGVRLGKWRRAHPIFVVVF